MHPDIQVRESAIEGRGVFADRAIPKDTALWKLTEAPGTYVTLAELKQLPVARQRLAYRYRDRYLLSCDGSECMNHSCDPNTYWLDDETMAASRDIEPDEEITFDYATNEGHPWWQEKWPCTCGAPNCRGVVSGRDCLDPAFAERYGTNLPSWTLEFMQRHAGWRGRLSWLLFVGALTARKVRAAVMPVPTDLPSSDQTPRPQEAGSAQ